MIPVYGRGRKRHVKPLFGTSPKASDVQYPKNNRKIDEYHEAMFHSLTPHIMGKCKDPENSLGTVICLKNLCFTDSD